jgi:diaminopimelate epimerase
MLKIAKYHGLGNDYLVIDPKHLKTDLSTDEIKLICHRNYGVGSDGILLGPLESQSCDFKLRIFNPDGSEAEKSGNGLRIFCRYLWDNNLVKEDQFSIETLGGNVKAQVFDHGKLVKVEMGKVSFVSNKIPVVGDERNVINETISIGGADYTFCAATVGNPHCVLPMEEISEELARKIGPDIETDARFPNRINVQLLKVLDRNNIQIEIWERGAGYTLASGSSSSAAAAVAYKLGLCDDDITVHMPGGNLEITISGNYNIFMKGPVTSVYIGEINPDMYSQLDS